MREARITIPLPLDYSGNESVNTVATNLFFAGRNMKKIIFTSCTASEGKSFLAMHTMLNLARRNRRVVLVDCDYRRSFLVRRFGIQFVGEQLGSAHYLNGQCGLEDIVYQLDTPGAYYCPIGMVVANPIPLIDSEYFADLLDTLAREFDVVLVDAPPIGVVVDAAVVGRSCDGCVFIVEYGKRHRRELVDAIAQMSQSGCALLGCVLNRVTLKSLSDKQYYRSKYYSYYHSYGDEQDGKDHRKSKAKKS